MADSITTEEQAPETERVIAGLDGLSELLRRFDLDALAGALAITLEEALDDEKELAVSSAELGAPAQRALDLYGVRIAIDLIEEALLRAVDLGAARGLAVPSPKEITAALRGAYASAER